ncbi:MAG: chemotaxis protein CheX [Acidobacteriota bacterium]|nr:chemotaxis protein CheX [Acidobacteriota bacterium]
MKREHEELKKSLDETVTQIVGQIWPDTMGSLSPAEAAVSEQEVVLARIEFAGSFQGECRLAMVPETAASMASEMLGGPCAPDEIQDAAQELCNMIAGHWKDQMLVAPQDCGLVPLVDAEDVEEQSPALATGEYRWQHHGLALSIRRRD